MLATTPMPDTNPYAPPQQKSVPERLQRRLQWHRPSILLVLATSGYGVFTLMLLTTSAPVDVMAGMLFLLNSWWLVMGTLWSARTAHRYQPTLVAFVAGIIQLLILVVMLLFDMGNEADVIEINGSIVGGFFLLTLVLAVLRSKQSEAEMP